MKCTSYGCGNGLTNFSLNATSFWLYKDTELYAYCNYHKSLANHLLIQYKMEQISEAEAIAFLLEQQIATQPKG